MIRKCIIKKKYILYHYMLFKKPNFSNKFLNINVMNVFLFKTFQNIFINSTLFQVLF